MAHLLIHSLRQSLASGCVPLFTSDGLNVYFSALTAHFGQWLQMHRSGREVLRWQVAAGLISGQVKKIYQRRKLARVRHVMRLGTQTDLSAALQGMGFGGAAEHGFYRADESDGPAWDSRAGSSHLGDGSTVLTPISSPGVVARLLSFCSSSRIATSGIRTAPRARWQASGATVPAVDASHGIR
jgi:hypothetical protein